MVKVVQQGRYAVYVYAEIGQRHHLPHCHVRWPDGECSIEIERLLVLDGDKLSTAARRMLREHQDEIGRAWVRLNPEREMR